MFDCYHRWLAIPSDQRPPTYYQLLGISPNETDPEVIDEAALRQASHVRTYQTGPYAQQCQALLNEIGQAKVTLLNPAKRKDYDARLGCASAVNDRKSKIEAPKSSSNVSVPSSIPDPRSSIFGAALTYLAILLLGAALTFWLSFTTP